MEYLAIISILIAISGFLYQQFAVISGIKERLTKIETKMDIFWGAIEGRITDMLKTYPTGIEKDILLDKMTRKELCLGEAERLRVILNEELKKNNDDAKKLAYVLALGRLEQIILDIKKCKKADEIM